MIVLSDDRELKPFTIIIIVCIIQSEFTQVRVQFQVYKGLTWGHIMMIYQDSAISTNNWATCRRINQGAYATMHVVLINMFKGFMLHTNNWGTCLDNYVCVYMKFT